MAKRIGSSPVPDRRLRQPVRLGDRDTTNSRELLGQPLLQNCCGCPWRRRARGTIVVRGAIVVTASPRVYGVRNMPALSARRPVGAEDGAAGQMIGQYAEAGRKAIAEPFTGITADGHVRPGLFSLAPTGIATN